MWEHFFLGPHERVLTSNTKDEQNERLETWNEEEKKRIQLVSVCLSVRPFWTRSRLIYSYELRATVDHNKHMHSALSTHLEF